MKPLKLAKPAEQVIQEGRKAEAILKDPVFVEAVEEAEARWIRQWRDAKTPEDREKCWALIHALEGVVNALGVTQQTGEIESRQSRMISNR